MAIRSLQFPTGYTLKTVLRDFSTGSVLLWNTSLNAGAGGFEAYNAANISAYGIATTEPNGTGVYVWTVPAALGQSAAGYEYQAVTYQIAGASLATTDLPNGVWLSSFAWDGTRMGVVPALPLPATAGGLATVDASNNVHGLQATDAIAAAVWSDASTYGADTKGAGVEKANKLTVTDNGRAGAVLIYDATGEVVVPTTLPPADSISVSSETIEVSDN